MNENTFLIVLQKSKNVNENRKKKNIAQNVGLWSFSYKLMEELSTKPQVKRSFSFYELFLKAKRNQYIT